jgi:hypothetical protein
MEELLKEAASLLSEVDTFGADDSVRRSKISRWLAKYYAAQQKDVPDGAKRRLTGRNGKPTNVLADGTLDPAPPVI